MSDSSEDSDTVPERNARRAQTKKEKGAQGLPSAETLLQNQSDYLPSVTGEDGTFNNLFWDQIIKYATSAMIALTLLDLLSSIRGDSVQCMTPSNFSRDQGAFINSYCTQFTPPTDFFPFYLVAQAILIFGVHFLWYSWFSGKFHHFLALATSLDRIKDNKTGDYSLRNFVLSRTLLKSFQNSKSIYLSYIGKLLLQFLFATLSMYFHFNDKIFGYYSAPFVCPRDNTDIPKTWPIGTYRVPCVLTSLVLLVAIRWLNVILLAGVIIAVMYGLLWCLWDHRSRLNWLMVARFSFESSLPSSLYVPKVLRLRYFSRRYCCKYRIRNDFQFLFLKLYREDAGHAQVLWEVLVDDSIGKAVHRQFERLNLWKKMDANEVEDLKKKVNEGKHANKRKDVVKGFPQVDRAKPGETLGNTLQAVLCNVLTAKVLGLKAIDALDIAFGTTGCKLQLAAKARRVVAVDFNAYYINEEEPVREKVYSAGIKYFRTKTTIFSEEEDTIREFRNMLMKSYYKNSGGPFPENPDEENVSGPRVHANVVVVGPIPADSTSIGSKSHGIEKDSPTIAIHWLLKWMEQYKIMDEDSYLLTLNPVAIEGRNVSADFVEFHPKWKSDESTVVLLKNEGDNIFEEEWTQHSKSSPVTLRCGWSNCDFKIKVYRFPPAHAAGATSPV